MGVLRGTRGYRGGTEGVLDGVLRCAWLSRAMRVCVCACAHLRVCVDLGACARVRACMRACVSACLCFRAFPSDFIFALVCVARECVRGGDVRYQKLGLRRALRLRARGCGRCDRPGSRASAAGVTWTCRTAKAEWTARQGHTSVVDAAGAIYVIGGGSEEGSTYPNFQDAWASTDGGARPDAVKRGGWAVGRPGGYYRGTREGRAVGTRGRTKGNYKEVQGLNGTMGVLRGSIGY